MRFTKSLSKDYYIRLSKYVYKFSSDRSLSSSSIVSLAVGRRRITLFLSFFIFFLSLFRLNFTEGFFGLSMLKRSFPLFHNNNNNKIPPSSVLSCSEASRWIRNISGEKCIEKRRHYHYSSRILYLQFQPQTLPQAQQQQQQQQLLFSECHRYADHHNSNMLIEGRCRISSFFYGWHNNRRSMQMAAAPKRGSIVDTYRSVDVLCTKCQTKLFKYKKKNGTKSKLVKMYIERIVDDPYDLLLNNNNDDDKNKNNSETTSTRSSESESKSEFNSASSLSLLRNETQKKKKILKHNAVENAAKTASPPSSDSHLSISCSCPKCGTKFGRPSFIKGLPAIAIVGGKLRMK